MVTRSRVLPPEQYFVPTQPMRQPAQPSSAHVDVRNVMMVSAANAGVGASVMSAMLAWTLVKRGLTCALVDLDMGGGGLDVLLGLENEPGLRLAQIEAPLGRIDGKALCHEIAQWEGVRVLACDASATKHPDMHEIRSIVRALSEACDVVILDSGQAQIVEDFSDCQQMMHVVAAELSVLGLVRAKRHSERLAARECVISGIVGIAPRGTRLGRGMVDLAEAGEYLKSSLIGPIANDAGLCSDVLEGLGIRSIGKASKRVIDQLADLVQQRLQPPTRRARAAHRRSKR